MEELLTNPYEFETIPELLATRARERPYEPFLHFEGRVYSNLEIWDLAGKVAGGLSQVGVRKGTHVALMLENEPLFYISWFALARLGAVEVPINTTFFGESLRHILSDSDAEVLIVGDVGLDAVGSLDALPQELGIVIGVGPRLPETLHGRATIVFDDLDGECPDVDVKPLDPMAVCYTSGTTGVSKGVVLCHRYFFLVGSANATNMRLGKDDRYFTCLPLFHAMAQLSGTMAPLLAGGDIVLTRKFSVSAFWETCRELGVTAFGAIAAMTSMLYSAPISDRDRDHNVRYGFAVATPATLHDAFEERFGVRLVNGYGLTEASMITYCPYDDRRPGKAGVAIPHFKVEIHDERGRLVDKGQVGEIVCRPLTPGAIMTRYQRRPDATIDAWRNLWLHTDDLGYMDADGFLTFVDRAKDAIRRRGENISSFEVETAISVIPGVAEVAAYAVPSDLGEDDVMVSVVRSDASLTPEQLFEFCRGVLPRFSIPTYIRFVEALPYTPTNKVKKALLREEGVTPDTWTVS
jgi:crotonobetaine/carnitine-CoA ligase